MPITGATTTSIVFCLLRIYHSSFFCGVTIHGAVMNSSITDKKREVWRGGKVKILVIDEISYFSDNDLKKLDKKLKDLSHP